MSLQTHKTLFAWWNIKRNKVKLKYLIYLLPKKNKKKTYAVGLTWSHLAICIFKLDEVEVEDEVNDVHVLIGFLTLKFEYK